MIQNAFNPNSQNLIFQIKQKIKNFEVAYRALHLCGPIIGINHTFKHNPIYF